MVHGIGGGGWLQPLLQVQKKTNNKKANIAIFLHIHVSHALAFKAISPLSERRVSNTFADDLQKEHN